MLSTTQKRRKCNKVILKLELCCKSYMWNSQRTEDGWWTSAESLRVFLCEENSLNFVFCKYWSPGHTTHTSLCCHCLSHRKLSRYPSQVLQMHVNQLTETVIYFLLLSKHKGWWLNLQKFMFLQAPKDQVFVSLLLSDWALRLNVFMKSRSID